MCDGCMRNKSKVRGNNLMVGGNEDGVVRFYNYSIILSSRVYVEADVKHVGKVKRVCFDEEIE